MSGGGEGADTSAAYMSTLLMLGIVLPLLAVAAGLAFWQLRPLYAGNLRDVLSKAGCGSMEQIRKVLVDVWVALTPAGAVAVPIFASLGDLSTDLAYALSSEFISPDMQRAALVFCFLAPAVFAFPLAYSWTLNVAVRRHEWDFWADMEAAAHREPDGLVNVVLNLLAVLFISVVYVLRLAWILVHCSLVLPLALVYFMLLCATGLICFNSLNPLVSIDDDVRPQFTSFFELRNRTGADAPRDESLQPNDVEVVAVSNPASRQQSETPPVSGSTEYDAADTERSWSPDQTEQNNSAPLFVSIAALQLFLLQQEILETFPQLVLQLVNMSRTSYTVVGVISLIEGLAKMLNLIIYVRWRTVRAHGEMSFWKLLKETGPEDMPLLKHEDMYGEVVYCADGALCAKPSEKITSWFYPYFPMAEHIREIPLFLQETANRCGSFVFTTKGFLLCGCLPLAMFIACASTQDTGVCASSVVIFITALFAVGLAPWDMRFRENPNEVQEIGKFLAAFFGWVLLLILFVFLFVFFM